MHLATNIPVKITHFWAKTLSVNKTSFIKMQLQHFRYPHTNRQSYKQTEYNKLFNNIVGDKSTAARTIQQNKNTTVLRIVMLMV